MPQRRSHNNLISVAEFISAIKESQVNPFRLIASIEEVITMENLKLEANQLINNEAGILQCEQQIDDGELLLSMLRRSLDRP
jgi:hypothetical protein